MKKVKIEMNPNWADLPEELLGIIHNKLCIVDRIYFRSVCKNWGISKDLINRCLGHLPWVIHGSKQIGHHGYGLCDPHGKTIYNLSPSIRKLSSVLDRKVVYASKFGWLLYSSKNHNPKKNLSWSPLILHNPFTNDTIEMPELDGFIYSSATFTTNPTTSLDSEVFVTCIPSSNKVPAIIHVGRCFVNYSRDRVWSIDQLERVVYTQCMHYDAYAAMHYVNRKLYCLSRYDNLQIYDLAEKSWNTVALRHGFTNDFPYYGMIWLAHDKNENLVMIRQSKMSGLRVFKIDWELGKFVDPLENDFKNMTILISGNVSISLTNNNDNFHGENKQVNEESRIFYVDNGKKSEFVDDRNPPAVIRCYSLEEGCFVAQPNIYSWIGQLNGSLTFIEPPYTRF